MASNKSTQKKVVSQPIRELTKPQKQAVKMALTLQKETQGKGKRK